MPKKISRKNSRRIIRRKTKRIRKRTLKGMSSKKRCLKNLNENCANIRVTTAQKYGKVFKSINQLIKNHSNIYIIPCEGRYAGKIFIMDENVVMKQIGKVFQHNCLVNNKDVVVSGVIKRVDEDTLWVDNESGHYMPQPERLKVIVKKMKELGFKKYKEENDRIFYPKKTKEALGIKKIYFKINK